MTQNKLDAKSHAKSNTEDKHDIKADQDKSNKQKVHLTPLSNRQALNLPSSITSIQYTSNQAVYATENSSNDNSKKPKERNDTHKESIVGDFPKRVSKQKPKNELTLVRLTLIMAVTIALITWLKTDKLAGYWMQNYDTNQPFAKIGATELGKFGQGIEGFANKNQIENGLSSISNTLNRGANRLFYSQELAKLDELAKKRALLTKQKEIARQKIKQQRQAQSKERAEQARLEALKPKVINSIGISSNQKALFIGDSLMQGVAPWVMRQLQSKYKIDSIDLSKHSTGLAFSQFFDWPATVEQTLEENPEVVALFVFLGGNDGQSVVDPKTQRHTRFASERWDELYIEKIQRIIKAAERHNVQIFWMTPPHMENKSLNNKTAHLTELFNQNIPSNLGLIVHSKELLQTDKTSDTYSSRMIINGKKTKVRTADGVHFTTKGQKQLASAIMKKITINGQPMLEK